MNHYFAFKVPIVTSWNDPVDINIDGELNNNDFDIYIGNDQLGRFIMVLYCFAKININLTLTVLSSPN